jgi:hypothetical protein
MIKNKYRENISAEELVNYELSWFRGKIVVVDNLETFGKILPLIQKQDRHSEKDVRTRSH